MIEVDIPMPEYCSECPCSYYVQYGKYEGRIMCQALEFREARTKIMRPDKGEYMVSDKEWSRPDKCPMLREF